MSLVNKQTITCPDCGKLIETTVWDSLNTKINPEMKKELINGNIFKTICKHCRRVQNVAYSMLYHDQPKKLMIYYAETDDDFEYALGEINHYCKIEKDYIFRIVRSQQELREKAMIFDNGFDDRIIEFIKYIFAVSAKEKVPTLKTDKTFLVKHNDEFCIQLSLENPEFLVFDTNYYNVVSEAMSEIIDDIKIPNYVVDLKWIKENVRIFVEQIEQKTNPNKEEITPESTIAVCKNCGEKLFNDNEFCHKCGEKVNKKTIKFCRKCGKKLIPNATFCQHCGTKIKLS